MSYHWDGGTPPSHEQKQKQKHNSDFERTMDPETTKMLWGIINENTMLAQENYMLKTQIQAIQKLLGE